ncbi:MAG: glycosyltransferase family 4 protein [Deltaproteobacteria bacterium]|nr:glycosyltransferase family 4 protein [Deltaproteobacteria bacterium]
MNILFVADVSIASLIGGAEKVLFEQSYRLAKRGHDVSILTRKLPDQKKNHVVINGVKEYRYKVDQTSSFSFLNSTIRNSKQLFESLHREHPFDCINFHQPFSAFGIIQSPASKIIIKIYTCHSLSFEEYISRNAKPDGYFKRLLYLLNIQTRKWMEKRVMKNSNAIVTLSQFTSDKLLDTYKIAQGKIATVPGGVDPEKFYPALDKKPIRQRLKFPREKVIIFTVRNLVHRMGLENLILAIKVLMNDAPHMYLVMGGEGPLKNELIRLAKQSGVDKFITFTGFISEEDLPDYYRMADLFVLPTRELEGFGLVTLEAMASGVPVLGTPVGGTREIIGEFNREFLFKDTTPDSMADLIAEKYRIIKDNPHAWKEISKQCRNYVERNYSWEKNVDALENICFMSQ